MAGEEEHQERVCMLISASRSSKCCGGCGLGGGGIDRCLAGDTEDGKMEIEPNRKTKVPSLVAIDLEAASAARWRPPVENVIRVTMQGSAVLRQPPGKLTQACAGEGLGSSGKSPTLV